MEFSEQMKEVKLTWATHWNVRLNKDTYSILQLTTLLLILTIKLRSSTRRADYLLLVWRPLYLHHL